MGITCADGKLPRDRHELTRREGDSKNERISRSFKSCFNIYHVS